jgi:hypothetical protein
MSNMAQVVDFGDLRQLAVLSKDLEYDRLEFELVENEEAPEEQEKVGPDYFPVMNEEELGYLSKIENLMQNSQQLQPQKPITEATEKEGKIVDLRKKESNSAEESKDSDSDKPKQRKLTFSLKKPIHPQIKLIVPPKSKFKNAQKSLEKPSNTSEPKVSQESIPKIPKKLKKLSNQAISSQSKKSIVSEVPRITVEPLAPKEKKKKVRFEETSPK